VGVQNTADRRDVGAATGAVTLMRMGGASIAISIYGAVLSSAIAAHVGAIDGVKTIAELTPAAMANLPAASRAAIAAVYSAAFGPVFLSMSAIVAIGFIAAICLKNTLLPTGR
jgi:hypothetical protein